MTYCCLELCRNPRVLAKWRVEIDELFTQNPSGPTYETLGGLKFLDSFIKEALRLHTVVPNLFKSSTEDTEIFGSFVPKGTEIFLDIFGLARDERYWGSDALEFKPERWSENFLPVEGSYVPFGDGPTNVCCFCLLPI